MTKIKPIQWANHLGWDIETKNGTAIVADAGSKLHVSIPIPSGSDGLERRLFCYVPLGTKPEAAFLACKANGTIHIMEYFGGGFVPMLDSPYNVVRLLCA